MPTSALVWFLQESPTESCGFSKAMEYALERAAQVV